jgi:hypothetical protein
MKEETVYYLLIGYVIFTVFQKSISLTVEYNFPTFRELNSASGFWKNVVMLRSFNNVVSIVGAIYFLYNYQFDTLIRAMLLLTLAKSSAYFIIDERYIYSFINETEDNKRVIHLFDVYGDPILNIFIGLSVVYALVVIFAPK